MSDQQENAGLLERVRVAIIGAGPGGLYAAIALRKAGIDDFIVLEKAADVGGTWWHNRYPGAECDVQSHLYSYTFEPKPDWSRPYAGQQEILDYLRHVADKYHIRPSCRFGVEVTAAQWQEDQALWLLTTQESRQLRADIVISAIGMFNDIVVPDIDGLDEFAGTIFHTARWPAKHELRGERVAIIGSAASAVQTIPEIAAEVAQLDVYQRTPQWVLPKEDEPFSSAELKHFRETPETVETRRHELYEQLEGVILFDDPRMLDAAEAAGLENIAQVNDPELRRRLTPQMNYGCRRPLLSNKYYPTFNRDNVTLVDCGIERIENGGITGTDGQLRPVDTIILATGFETTHFLASLEVQGRGGRSIQEAWRDGAQAYLGITTSGFPNLFMLYGPNTNNGSLIYMLELEVDYIVRHIKRMQQAGLKWIDVRNEAMQAYNHQLQQDIAAIKVWGADCRGYYRVPSGRIVTQLPYDMTTYRQLTNRQDQDAYDAEVGRA